MLVYTHSVMQREELVNGLLRNLDEIYYGNKKNTIIYVAIGSAAHMVEEKVEDGIKRRILSPDYNQQYPVFLENMKSRYPNDPMHIFLMDPELECRPWMVADPNDSLKLNGDFSYNGGDGYDMYFSPRMNISVYGFPYYVSCPSDEEKNEKCVMIGLFLNALNKMGMERGWLIVVNDFRGSNNKRLASYYDKTIAGHHDHIVYGLGAREDSGCYIELSQPKCDFVHWESDDGIRVFNPYHYEFAQEELGNITKEYYEMYMKCPTKQMERNCNIVNSQIEIFYNTKLQHIDHNIMTLYRQVFCLRKGICVVIMPENYTYVNKFYNVDVSGMLCREDFEILFVKMTFIVKKELREMLVPLLSHKDASIIINELMNHLSKHSQYEWGNLVKGQLIKSWKRC